MVVFSPMDFFVPCGRARKITDNRRCGKRGHGNCRLQIAHCRLKNEEAGKADFCRFFAVSLLFNMQSAMCNLQFSLPPRTFGTHWNLFALHSVAIRTRSVRTGTRLEATGTCLPPLPKP
jgi:hypothetical protein